MEYVKKPLKEILSDRKIYNIFHTEFQKSTWLDLEGLKNSESSIEDLYKDEIIPKDVLDAIVARLQTLI